MMESKAFSVLSDLPELLGKRVPREIQDMTVRTHMLIRMIFRTKIQKHDDFIARVIVEV